MLYISYFFHRDFVATNLHPLLKFIFLLEKRTYCFNLFEQTTATHQLKNAVTSDAFSGRALILSSLCKSQSDDSRAAGTLNDLIVTSLSNALLGMDANDPPKTIATMQLIGSIFSNVSVFIFLTFSCTVELTIAILSILWCL